MKKSIGERFLKSTYVDKGTDYSASDFTKAKYQLWVSKHFEVEKSDIMGFKATLGQAWHAFCEDPEISVVKEFSHITKLGDTTIGGTSDLLEWDTENNIWVIGDIKTKGVYPAKKFAGIGSAPTKKNPDPKKPDPEQDKEIMQLSVYRWLFKDLFTKISDTAVIYLYVIGHSARERAAGLQEYSEIEIPLIPLENVEKDMLRTIEIAESDQEPAKDCEDWLCDYCEYKDVCPFIQRTKTAGFKNLS